MTRPRFCVPENKVFLSYWDQVEDRLYKIRHSLNIDGVFRSLDLFQPPIDPSILVRAVAAGSLSGGLRVALASVNLPIPHYRYGVMLEKAKEMLGQVIELGGALLQALEKKDAEELTLLLNTHELNLLNRTTEIRKLQKEEVEINLKALEVSLQSSQEQKTEYERRINKGISSREQAEISLLRSASALRIASGALRTAASAVGGTPDYTVGGAGSMGTPVGLSTFGGSQGSTLLSLTGVALELGADVVGTEAQTTGIFANYDRRTEDWELQKTIANFDIAQIEEQIEANSIQIEMATREIQIHEQTIEQQKEVHDFYRNKFTNKDLYNWMSRRWAIQTGGDGFRSLQNLPRVSLTELSP